MKDKDDNLNFNDLDLDTDNCAKCGSYKKVIIFGGMKFCEPCLVLAKDVVRKWVNERH